jgi:adenine specific DNA methylase Mod
MTPEELNRTIDFIVQSQARFAAAQEQDRQERVEFQKWAKDLNLRVVDLIQTQTRALDMQSRRLDQYETQQRVTEQAVQRRHEELHQEFLEFMRETRKWHQEFQRDAQKRHEEALARLDRILDKLTDRIN